MQRTFGSKKRFFERPYGANDTFVELNGSSDHQFNVELTSANQLEQGCEVVVIRQYQNCMLLPLESFIFHPEYFL